ncbi:hypothetical protein ACJMK2_037058 [Sinanodonta woodiana]|uniref:Uncharacterized protein n=1 Tax=Sinanodonta woodiana TaxID=1069815 RepID=A0ABD3WJ29_SINWO
MEVVISNEMMTYASSARHKCHAYLDKKKAEKKDEKTNPKGKKRELALKEVEELKSKKLHLEADIASLHASFVQKAEEAELKGLTVFVTESNALRRRAEEKMTVVASLFKMIED